MRRVPLILAVAATLGLVSSATAAFQPVRRNFGELEIPRVRAGQVVVPRGHANGRVTMIVTLGQPPLAAHYGRSRFGVSGTRRLDVNSAITSILPNTKFVTGKLRVVDHPTVTWLLPDTGECAGAKTELLVVGGATRKIANVRFSVDGRAIGTVKTGAAGLYTKTWSSKGLARGSHSLQAIVTDSSGATASATHAVKACSKKQ